MSLFRIAGLALVALLALAAPATSVELSKLTFETSSGPRVFQIEIADTAEQRQVGLMYRRSMADDHGMLFDFGRAEEISMWMQNTYISLDMVFVGGDGRVTRIAEKTEPLSTRVISSGAPARYVVELVAGAARRIGLKPGDKVVHPRVGA
ncbi:DUF192 domain-containing protein [Methylopila sp. M107]|uniref:DUF192 domain-containing protein n=1 Tax=Methylopila sp. M107 TaxID=1101190 RepID=UPI00035DA8FE|nr:DUF192 domain-containing protein [Methylopila sp. M107]